jgi:hypothetical protein
MNQCIGFGDWCSGWFDGTWGHCCAIHDIMYSLQYDRIPADIALGSCVARNGPWWMGVLMGLAVLAVGYPAWRKAKFYKLKTDGK